MREERAVAAAIASPSLQVKKKRKEPENPGKRNKKCRKPMGEP